MRSIPGEDHVLHSLEARSSPRLEHGQGRVPVQGVGHPHRWAETCAHMSAGTVEFEAWLEVAGENPFAGKYVKGDTCDPKTWKANFRCAMNSLPDIEEVKDKSVNKGQLAMRVFRMLPQKQRGGPEWHSHLNLVSDSA